MRLHAAGLGESGAHTVDQAGLGAPSDRNKPFDTQQSVAAETGKILEPVPQVAPGNSGGPFCEKHAQPRMVGSRDRLELARSRRPVGLTWGEDRPGASLSIDQSDAGCRRIELLRKVLDNSDFITTGAIELREDDGSGCGQLRGPDRKHRVIRCRI